MTKALVLLIMCAIVMALGRGLFFLVKDEQPSLRTVNALSIRIGLSLLLFVLLVLGCALGFIQPHGV